MSPFFLAVLLLLHALAHAAPGMWAAGSASAWLVTPVWVVAMCGFMAAAFGIFGVESLGQHVERISRAALAASVVLLWLAGVGAWSVIGLALGALLCASVHWWVRCTHPEIHTSTRTTREMPIVPEQPTRRERVGTALAHGALWATALLIVLRPWYQTWGTRAEERGNPVPGVVADDDSRYRIDHAITIQAPTRAVWPWVAQLGQDRAGFYSYAWLERAFGFDIHNSDSLVGDWQQRAVGELVRAAQPDFLGGRFGRELGWRISRWDPPRSMTLENWGTFVVTPVNDSVTRLRVHTRGPGRPSAGAVPFAWVGFYFFEPGHFIMEREMLQGIRRRAEQQYHAPVGGQ